MPDKCRVTAAAWVLAGTCWLIAATADAQSTSVRAYPTAGALNARVEAYFTPIVTNHDFAGAVLIARGDQILVDRAFGLADAQLGIRSTTEGRYVIASVTKTFTAAAIVMLAERGTLRLEDPLSRILPDFPRAGDITILHLLRHEAGLDNPDYRDALKERIDLAELVRRIAARPRLFEPGTTGRYSNAGYNVLARVIEVASGMSYEDFLRRNIFAPLGMTATGYFGDEAIVPGLVRGFLPGPAPAGVIHAPWSDIGFTTGAGGLVSTTGDLYRWARAVHTERLFRRSALSYPYGWGRLGADRRAGIEQTGLATGFTASLAIWFSDSLYVVVLGNIESARWGQWSADLAALARGDTVSVAPVRHEVELDPALVPRFVGRYATDEHTIDIAARLGALWLLLDGWPVPKYLAPVAANRFELRSDFGHIVFDTSATGKSQQLMWVFGPDARTVYPRR